MDYQIPKTRKDTKGNKYKPVYNSKYVRRQETLLEKTNPRLKTHK